MLAFALIAAFAYGTVTGSFLNAVLWRMHVGDSVLRGRSRCTTCGHGLAWYDLLPLVSWLALRGRCRYCKEGVSTSYPLIEATVGVLFALFTWQSFGSAPLAADALLSVDAVSLARLLFQWYLAATLVGIFVYDHRHMLIPRAFTTKAIVISVAAGLALGMPWHEMAIGAVIGYGVFWLQLALSRGKWIGGGDLHLGLLMGVVLGWPLVLVALFLAYVGGAGIAVALLAGRKAGWKSEIPFGTFLSAATLVTMLWGGRILDWYLHLAF